MPNTGNTQQQINYGASANDGLGDPLRTAFIKTDENFDNIWLAGPVGSNITITNNTVQVNNTNGNLVLKPNGIGVIENRNHSIPWLNNTYDLGSANLKWRTVHANTISVTDLSIPGNLAVGGNLTVSGNIIEMGNIVTDSKTIQLANTASNAAQADGAGITVGANDDIATILYDSTSNSWIASDRFSTGNLILTDDRIMDLYGPSITNADLISGPTSGLDIVPNGDANATVLYNTYGNVQIYSSNTGSNVKTFTFGYDGSLSLSGISATGNVTGNYFFGNGSQLTGITSYANANAVAYGESGWAGNIIPSGNAVYSLGSATNQWSDLYVSNTTIYLNNVPISLTAGNVLTVDGEAVLTNDSNTTITTTGNITADYFFGNGSQLTGLSTGSISNGTSNVEIATADGNVTINTNGTYAWSFDDTGNLTLPNNGSIVVDGGDGVIGPVSDDLVIAWDNEEIRLVSVQGSIEMQADNAFRVQTNYDGGTDTYLSRWEFSQDEIVNITGPSAIVTEAGDLTLSGGRDGLSSGNVSVVAVNNGVVVNTWNFDNTGNLTLPPSGNIVGATANNAGRIQWLGNSSGDGAGYTTLGLIPDETLVGNDQYLIIDPTAPGHIHIRAGGTQDNSNADLFLGGENSYFKVSAGANNEVRISANSHAWVFGADSTLIVPGEGVIRSILDTVILQSYDIYGNTYSARLGTDGGLYFETTDYPSGWLNLTNSSGNANINSPSGNINITSDVSVTGNVTANYFIGDGSQLTGLPASYSDSNVATFLAAYGSNTISTTGNITAGNFIGSGSNVELVAQTEQWVFDTTGNLTAAGNLISPNAFVINSSGQNVLFLDQFGIRANTQITLSAENFATGNNSSILFDKDGGGIVLRLEDTTPVSKTWGFYQGNITFPDGSVQTSAYGNANVTTLLSSFGSNNITTTGNITGNTAGYTIGYRDIPQVTLSANVTAALTDAGKHFYSTTAGNLALTLPDNVSVTLPTGATLTIVVNAVGNVLINQGAGVSLYQAGSATTGNRVVGAYGLATVMKVAANTWVISGTGVY